MGLEIQRPSQTPQTTSDSVLVDINTQPKTLASYQLSHTF